MNYFRCDCYNGDFYHEALLCGFHAGADSDDYIDESGAFPEINDTFFGFASSEGSDLGESGDLNAS